MAKMPFPFGTKTQSSTSCTSKLFVTATATEIPHSVAVAVTKSFDVQLVDDCVFVPKGIGIFAMRLRHEANSWRTNGARQVIDVPIACEQNALPSQAPRREIIFITKSQ